jgi:hypothetical protein
MKRAKGMAPLSFISPAIISAASLNRLDVVRI